MNPWSFRESVSSQTCWSLRNIHFLNGNIYFSVSVNIFFPRSQVRLLPDTTISVQRRVSYKKQELFTIRENLCLPRIIGGVLVSHLFRFFFVLLFAFILYLCVQGTGYHSREDGFTSVLQVGSFFHFLYCVFILFASVLYLVCPILPVPLTVHSWLSLRFTLTIIYNT